MSKPSILQSFLKYTATNVFGMLGLSCYILVDTFFISAALGANGLAALNLAIPIYSIMNGVGLMLAMGGGTIYAIMKGQENEKAGNTCFTHTFFFCLILSVLFALIGAFFSDPIARILGANEEIFDMTSIYLKVILLYSPAFMMNNVLNSFVRNDGNPALAMTGMLAGSFANIVLDYLFMFPMKLGMFGAVFATGLSAAIGICVLSLHFFQKKNQFRLVPFHCQPALLFRVCQLGFPSFVTEVSSGIVIIIFNILILNLSGNVGIAAYGVIANLSLVVLSLYNGIAQGAQPLISNAYGKGDAHSSTAVLKYAIITMICLSALLYIGIFFLADPITGIFNSENNLSLQKIAVPGLRLYFSGILFAGFNIILAVYFSSIEKALPAQVISLLRGFFLIVPMAFLLAWLFQLTGIWLTFPAS